MLREQGLGPLPVEVVRDLIGRGMPRLVERSLQAAGLALPCERLEAALRSFGAHHARLNGSSSRPFPGVLEATGLAPLFDTIVTSDQAGSRKPHPGPFLHACRTLGVAPAEAAVIGDSANDAEVRRRRRRGDVRRGRRPAARLSRRLSRRARGPR
jgi:phosphoglycolate phosphatase